MSGIPNSFADVIMLWPTVATFAADLDIPYQTAAAWKQRDNIPSGRWVTVVESAARRNIGSVTLSILAAFAKERAASKIGPAPRKRRVA